MEIKVTTWSGERRDELAYVFARAFVADQGMISLLGKSNATTLSRLTTWFDLTLKVWPKAQVLVAAAPSGFVGGMLYSLPDQPPPAHLMAKWFMMQALALGLKVPWRTVQHEQKRGGHLPDALDMVVEFVAVDEQCRGQGLASRLFEQAYKVLEPPASVGLETANEQNLAIYEHMGYQINARYRQDDVDYVVMSRALRKDG